MREKDSILDKYFDTVRKEPALSEKEVRRIVQKAGISVRTHSSRQKHHREFPGGAVGISKWMLAIVGFIIAVLVVLYFVLGLSVRHSDPILPESGDTSKPSVLGPLIKDMQTDPDQENSFNQKNDVAATGKILKKQWYAKQRNLRHRTDQQVYNLQEQLTTVSSATATTSYSQLTLLQPNGGEVFLPKDTIVIKWAGVDTSQSVFVEFSRDSGNIWFPLIGNAKGNQYIWRAPELSSIGCLIRVSLKQDIDTISRVLRGHRGWINAASYSPSGNAVATTSDDSTAILWDPTTGNALHTLVGHTGHIFWSAFNHNGSMLATVSADSTGKLWDVATGQLLHTLKGHTAAITHTAFSPDGEHVATSSDDGSIKIWDAQSGQLARTLLGHTDGVHSVEYSPDGSKIISGSRDKSVIIWDTSGTIIRYLIDHENIVNSAVYSSDGTRIVSVSRDRTARIWDADSGQLLHTLKGYTYWLWDASFSPDGRLVATADQGGYIKIWDAENGKLLHTWYGHNGEVGSARFSPDGTKLLTAANDKLGRLWFINLLNEYATDVSDSEWTIAN